MSFCLDVKGDYACFTRPEMKVERVSYDVITPSSARAIFEAILWKPAIQWSIKKIEVLKPIKWISLRRNELGSVLPVGSVTSAMKSGKNLQPCIIEDNRQQRAGLFLRDVHYRIYAEFQLTEKKNSGDNPGKFTDMFRRRAKRGQCFYQPYLGCREFACDFKLFESVVDAEEKPIELDSDLGWMLYDLDFSQKDNPVPMFFRARLSRGIMIIPDVASEEVRK
ncbi:type I-C CRISPR-associated protein Cas5c [Candidatus Riflebacteria bacterium]